MVNHFVECAENRKSRRMPDPADGIAGGFDVEGNAPNPFHVVANEEEAVRCRELVMKPIQDDPFIVEMFQCIEPGFVDPRDTAEVTGRSIEEIYTAKKRFQRAVDAAIRKHRRLPRSKP